MAGSAADARDDDGAPLIGRIAGLPAEVVERMATALCDGLDEDARLHAALAASRAALADRLHEAVPAADPALRRLLLAVRRDCHNARPVARHQGAPLWAALRALAGPLADEVLEGEARAAERETALRAAFERERQAQRARLREPLADAGFVRALALASPEYCRAAIRLKAAEEPATARVARSEAALLRYVTRAAVKVSPFSAFTPVALGTLRKDAGPAGIRLRGGGERARSLVRLRRYRLQQYVDALCRHPAFREGLGVEINDSAAETEPGRLLFLRPARWEGDAERGALRLTPDALGRTAADTPLLRRVAALTAAGPVPYGALVASLEREQGPAAGEMERLLDLGVLRLVFPWPVHEGRLEARLCAYLRTLSAEPGLERFRERLQRLVALEDGFARAADPAAAVEEMHALVDGLWQAAAPLGGMDPARIPCRGSKAFDVYEDVLLLPEAEDAPDAPRLHLSRGAAESALRSAAPLVRMAVLADHRHELRATLADFAAERWPGRGEVGAMELFHAFQPLWRQYLAFRAGELGRAERLPGWNPRGLAELAALDAWRGEVNGALRGCVVPHGDERRVDEAALDALLDRVPARYTDASAFGAALFLQPASTDGTRWRLNAIREGTGRAGSRYTPVMDDEARRAYAARLTRGSVVALGGETAFLLDVQCVSGDTVNVHAPLAAAVLSLPGDDAGVAPHRRVRLRELRVRFQGPHREPVLRGADGRRFLPVHLGLAYEAYMPSIVRFLCAFGPSELGAVLPPRAWRDEGEVRVADRTLLGSLVVHRRGWSVPAAPLAAALAGDDDPRAFADANRLRRAWGLPDRVFCAEPVDHELAGRVFKPQYVDFTSPLFLPLLRAAAGGGAERIAFEEMLPTPEMFPRGADGRRRAVEVIVDSAALRGPVRLQEFAPSARPGRAHPRPAATAAG